MRHPRVVAVVALTAAIAAVAVPGPVGSRGPSLPLTTDPDLFEQVEVAAAVRGPAMTIQPLDPAARSDGVLGPDSTLVEPAEIIETPQTRARVVQPRAKGGSVVINKPKPVAKTTPRSAAGGGWKYDREISWYGPGFYGRRTACGQALTKTLQGVAHRSLPCGTRVSFRHNGRVVTVPVVDRGPYVDDRQFDLTGGACVALRHCFTGPIEWKLAGG